MRKRFDEIKIGDTVSEEKIFEKGLSLQYAEASGDYNPIHLSPAYAKRYFGGVHRPWSV